MLFSTTIVFILSTSLLSSSISAHQQHHPHNRFELHRRAADKTEGVSTAAPGVKLAAVLPNDAAAATPKSQGFLGSLFSDFTSGVAAGFNPTSSPDDPATTSAVGGGGRGRASSTPISLVAESTSTPLASTRAQVTVVQTSIVIATPSTTSTPATTSTLTSLSTSLLPTSTSSSSLSSSTTVPPTIVEATTPASTVQVTSTANALTRTSTLVNTASSAPSPTAASNAADTGEASHHTSAGKKTLYTFIAIGSSILVAAVIWTLVRKLTWGKKNSSDKWEERVRPPSFWDGNGNAMTEHNSGMGMGMGMGMGQREQRGRGEIGEDGSWISFDHEGEDAVSQRSHSALGMQSNGMAGIGSGMGRPAAPEFQRPASPEYLRYANGPAYTHDVMHGMNGNQFGPNVGNGVGGVGGSAEYYPTVQRYGSNGSNKSSGSERLAYR